MSAEMYQMKPFYEPGKQVKQSDVMYRMKNLHTTGNTASTENGLGSDPITALGKRQDAIFARLDGLKQKLDSLKGKYLVPTVTSTATGTIKTGRMQSSTVAVTAPSPLGSYIHDIVINADPSSPPLSLFVMFEMLKQNFTVLATSYIHSSVTNVDSGLVAMIKNGCQVTRGNHQIALSVVWKKVENGPELMVSPISQSVITGEVNIVRYINRLLSPAFDTADIIMATQADEWLDTADLHIFNGNSKQRNAAVKNINNRLKKNAWLVGESFSFVDAVLWSALNQTALSASAPEPVQKWLRACTNLPLFSSAKTLVS